MKATFRIKETGKIIKASEIPDMFECGDISFHIEDIEALGLTIEPIEPKKRKLYAYKDSHGWISHRVDLDNKALDIYTRCEKYDIEFEE